VIRLDYSDFYKFLASLGLVLIGSGFLFPWLLVNNPVDSLSDSEFAALQESSKILLVQRQQLLTFLTSHVFWVSGLLIALGLFLTIAGFKMWWGKQKQVDFHDLLKRQIDEKNLQQMSQGEIRAKALKEAEADLEAEAPKENLDPNLEGYKDEVAKLTASIGLRYQYLGIDMRLADKLSECLPAKAVLRRNRKIGNAEFDMVIDFGNQDFPNTVIEVKYIKKGFKFNWFQETVNKLVLLSQIYSDEISQISNGILIIVLADIKDRFINYQYYYQKIGKDLPDNISICFIGEEDIQTFPCNGIWEKLFTGGYLQT
jgi:hypothetical protein